MNNEVLKTRLLKNDLPAFVNDALGGVVYGPSLKTQSNDVFTVDGKDMTMDKLLEKSNQDAEANALTSELVAAMCRANPYELVSFENAGFVSRWWNNLTGRNESKLIEFNLYCRRVEKIAERAPSILNQVKLSISINHFLKQMYESDIELLEHYIEAGYAFVSSEEADKQVNCPIKEHGLIRLRRRLVNMKVMQASLEMHRAQVDMSLANSLNTFERLNDSLTSLLHMWRHQIQMFKAGKYDIPSSGKIDKEFKTLVNKINANNVKGKRHG
ncbi:hypothetical protein ACI0X9_003262 [Cronobacter turicensis]